MYWSVAKAALWMRIKKSWKVSNTYREYWQLMCQHMASPLPPLKNADILYGRSVSINHVIHQPTAENLKTWTNGVSLNLKRDNQFCFFAIQDAEDEEDDDDKKKDKDKDKKKDGKGRARHMFSLFLNLRICLKRKFLWLSLNLESEFWSFHLNQKSMKVFLYFCPSSLKWVKSKKECKLLY